jgi:hypothetical protein
VVFYFVTKKSTEKHRLTDLIFSVFLSNLHDRNESETGSHSSWSWNWRYERSSAYLNTYLTNSRTSGSSRPKRERPQGNGLRISPRGQRNWRRNPSNTKLHAHPNTVGHWGTSRKSWCSTPVAATAAMERRHHSNPVQSQCRPANGHRFWIPLLPYSPR